MSILIKNLRNERIKDPWDIKVDRSSVLGNPYPMSNEKYRDMVCELYDSNFKEAIKRDSIKSELERLLRIYKQYGKLNLFCWCFPKRCHAETIRDYLNEKKD